MNFFPKPISTFHKLKFSYILLVILVAFLISGVAYTCFSAAFNREIEQTNAVLLRHYQNVINTVLENADKLSLTLSVKQLNSNDIYYFFHNPLDGNYAKILSIYRQLKETMLANFEIVDSICVYYDSAQMLISSTTGVNFLDEYRDDYWANNDLVIQIDAGRGNNKWLDKTDTIKSLILANSENTIYSFIRPYPSTSNASQIKGFIAVNINKDALNSVVSQFKDLNYGILYIVDESGKIILNSHPTTQSDYLLCNMEFDTYEGVSYEPINEIVDIDGQKIMVSHVNLYNGWKLVHAISINEFYSKTILIRKTIAVICFIAIVLGLVIAELFTRNIYTPLKLLINKIFDSKNESVTNIKNEYSIINKYIDNLSIRMEEIEQIIDNNRPLINHTLVTNLALGKITTEEELNGLLELNGITMPHDNFRVILIQFSERQFNNITMGNKQRIKYLVTDYIDSLSDAESVFVTGFNSEHEATIIVNTCKSLKEIEQLAVEVISHLESFVKLEVRISIGKPVEIPTDLKFSYTHAKNILKYAFFRPDKKIFTEENNLNIKNVKEKMPADLMENFCRALRERKLDEIQLHISRYVELAQSGQFTYDTCWDQLVKFVTELEDYIEITKLNIDNLKEDTYGILLSMYDIYDFEKWLINKIGKVFQALNQVEEDKNSIVVQNAISFVLDNLENGPSLREVAEHVCLSPSHFSKIFKQVTGKNFVDFVMEERINKAKNILLEDDQITIEEVAQKVGYNSTAYFINKFKLVHGVTPKNFRLLFKNNNGQNHKGEFA